MTQAFFDKKRTDEAKQSASKRVPENATATPNGLTKEEIRTGPFLNVMVFKICMISVLRNRFQQIKRCLHVSDPDETFADDEWYEKIEPLNLIIQIPETLTFMNQNRHLIFDLHALSQLCQLRQAQIPSPAFIFFYIPGYYQWST
jgi:hypothetical protein